jgi:hypothetical protein
LASYAKHVLGVPAPVRRLRRIDELPPHLRCHVGIGPGKHYVWLAWVSGEQMSLLTGALALERSQERGRPVLEIRRYHALGRETESYAALNELIRKYGRTTPYGVAYALAFRGEIDRTFEWLEKAVEYGDVVLSTLFDDPMMVILHPDPRWLPLLHRLGQAPDQLAAIKFDVKVPN